MIRLMRLLASAHPIELEPKNILCSRPDLIAVILVAAGCCYEAIKVDFCCRWLNENVGVPGVIPTYRAMTVNVHLHKVFLRL